MSTPPDKRGRYIDVAWGGLFIAYRRLAMPGLDELTLSHAIFFIKTRREEGTTHRLHISILYTHQLTVDAKS